MTPNQRTYTLNEQDEQFLETILGDLPTKSGAWILLNKMQAQKQAQQAEAAAKPKADPTAIAG